MARIEPFEQYSDRYEKWFEKNPVAYQSELKSVAHLLDTCGQIIEVGVGSGRFAVPLEIEYGIDPSPTMLELAISRDIIGIQGIAESLPIKPNRFDGVLLVTTICFVDDIAQTLSEAYRILRPGGQVVIGFIDRDSPIGAKYQSTKAENPFYRHATFVSMSELRFELQSAGFFDFQCVQTIFDSPSNLTTTEQIKPGHGEGLFVVLAGRS